MITKKYHGLLLVDKPAGLSSHDVVAQIRKIFWTKEVGHSGTLDPMATGLMVLLLGEATKLSNYITDGDKAYQVSVRMGIETDTLDTTGTVIQEKPVLKSTDEISNIALGLTGEHVLPIPMYSAKKIDGKKMYEYARENQVIEIPQKKMTFWDVQKNEKSGSDLSFSIQCSKGSFIRSWVKLLGEKCDTAATMSALRRTRSHLFKLENAVTFETLKSHPDHLEQFLISMSDALPEVKKIKVKGQDETLLRNGQISHDLRAQLIIKFNPEVDELIQICPSSGVGILALIGIEPEKGFKIKRIFNL
jgi:tRNA pseudouridine55 synthase